MQVIKADQMALTNPVFDLVETRQHDPEPGATALAKRNDDGISLRQLAIFLASPQPAISRFFALFGQPEQ